MKLKREINIITLVFLCCLSIRFTNDFVIGELINYAIISGSITLIFIILTINYIVKTRSEKAIYKNFVKSTLKKYDAVLVSSNHLPDLTNKNIVRVDKFDDLIDAQIELKKPIYYKEYIDYIVFILIDNSEACVNIVKLNDTVNCEYEVKIEKKIRENLVKDVDKSLLDNIDKTTIIRLDNAKSFKVSPVRKELVPKKYFIKKTKIYCILKDGSKKQLYIRDIIDFTKVFDKDNRLKNITVTTKDYRYVLKGIGGMDLKNVEIRLLERLNKIDSRLDIKVEYQQS